MPKVESKLKELLARIEQAREEDITSVTLRGLACSQSKNNLHLAVSNGVISIPIANIEDVTELNPVDKTQVAIKIRNPDSIKYLKRMTLERNAGAQDTKIGGRSILRPLFASARNSDDIEWPPVYGPGVNTSVCVTTVTDGNACDDSECVDSADDIYQ